jgi:glycosyltransferase involved in cell wall biosynthesis
MKCLYFTICAQNYLAYALSLRASVLAVHPGADFRIVLADELAPAVRARVGDATIIEAKALEIPTFFDMAFRYSLMELNTAIKPPCFQHFFAATNVGAVVYFDPDIWLLRPLEHVHALLDAGKDVVVTPHITEPLDDGGFPDDQRHLQTGVYNLGFCAFRRSEQTFAFLDWWANKMLRGCRVDLESGIFVDQKYMDMLTCFIDEVGVLRHPGYNVAYWNLPHRAVRHDGKAWRSKGEPLYFFHFSGIEPGRPEVFSKHQDRYESTDDIGEAKELVQQYLDRLRRHNNDFYAEAPYKYGTFIDGNPIIAEMRRIYGEAQGPAERSFEQVFAGSADLFLAASEHVPHFPGVPFTTLMYEIWRKREDLRQTFVVTNRTGQLRFLRWFIDSVPREYRVAPAFILPLKAAAAAAAAAEPKPVSARAPEGSLRSGLRKMRGMLAQSDSLRAVYRLLPLGLRSGIDARVFGFVSAPKPAAAAGQGVRYIGRHARANVDLSHQPGVTVLGFLRAESGLGAAARGSFRALKESGYPVEARSISAPEFQELDDSLAAELKDSCGYRHLLLHINADNTLTLPTRPDSAELRGRYRIGMWTWELSRFPSQWLGAFDHVDEIWVPSEFVRHTIAQATPMTVLTMPHPVPVLGPSRAFDRRYFGLRDDALVVLTSLDLNSYIERKNPWGAIEAMRCAFHDRDDVQLVIKLHGKRSFTKARIELEKASSSLPNVTLIDRVLSREQMTALQWCCDVYLSLHRSEGFGLNIAECMAFGKLAVATDYSGNRDFLDETCGAPVSFSLKQVRPGEYPFAQGQWWAEPDVGHAADLLRKAARDPSWRLELGRRAQKKIRDELSFAAVGRKMRQRLEQIDLKLSGRVNMPALGADQPVSPRELLSRFAVRAGR